MKYAIRNGHVTAALLRRIATLPTRFMPAPGKARGVVLTYHRIANVATDPQCLAVTPRNFADHLEVLRQWVDIVPLDQMSRTVPQIDHRRPTVAITFDDGYVDILSDATPLLARHDIPATVFVVSGHMDHQTEFWWDQLERLILLPESLPQTLTASVNGNRREWHLDRDLPASPSDWNVLCEARPTPRQQVYLDLVEWMQHLSPEEQTALVESLCECSASAIPCRDTHRPLYPEEVRTLHRHSPVTIGAHTVSHPILSALPVSQQRAELENCKGRLESLIESPVETFAYPDGRTCSYTAETVAMVKEAGFKTACTTSHGVVSDPNTSLTLPRWNIRNWDAARFESEIMTVLNL